MSRVGASARKLGVLSGLYLAQGLPFGFFTQALPVLLRQSGMSLEAIGMSTWLALPWGLKFLWAPVLDRFASRRQWILGLQGAGVLLCLGIAALDPTGALWPLAAAVLLTNLVAATQDVATDGLAVSWLDHEERGWGNGIQVAGYRVGMILGGGALLVVYGWYGWTSTLSVMAAGLALSTLPLLAAGEVGQREAREALPSANPWSWITRPGALRWAAVLVAFKVGDYTVGGMLRPWLVDTGWTAEQLGFLLGGVAFGAGLVGALLGGALVAAVGRQRSLVGFGLLQSAGLGCTALAAATGAGAVGVGAAVVAEHLLGGMATAALFTAMMDASREDDAGTDYTVQASIVVFASLGGASLSGWLAGALGYPLTFALGAALSVLGPGLAAVIRPPRS